ncbi:MAG: NAD(P)-binding domain-containing protein [Paracoccaceae bacterium]
MALTEMTRIAVIGAGDLGAAIIAALIARGGIAPERIVAVTSSGAAPRLADRPALTVARDPARAAAAADITLLAVPPAAAAACRWVRRPARSFR